MNIFTLVLLQIYITKGSCVALQMQIALLLQQYQTALPRRGAAAGSRSRARRGPPWTGTRAAAGTRRSRPAGTWESEVCFLDARRGAAFSSHLVRL